MPRIRMPTPKSPLFAQKSIPPGLFVPGLRGSPHRLEKQAVRAKRLAIAQRVLWHAVNDPVFLDEKRHGAIEQFTPR